MVFGNPVFAAVLSIPPVPLGHHQVDTRQTVTRSAAYTTGLPYYQFFRGMGDANKKKVGRMAGILEAERQKCM